jgi:hypothetical protein
VSVHSLSLFIGSLTPLAVAVLGFLGALAALGAFSLGSFGTLAALGAFSLGSFGTFGALGAFSLGTLGSLKDCGNDIVFIDINYVYIISITNITRYEIIAMNGTNITSGKIVFSLSSPE